MATPLTFDTTGTTGASGQVVPGAVQQVLRQLGYPDGSLTNPAPQWALTFAQDMVDAGNAGDYFGSPFGGGFKLPAGLSVGEFTNIETWAHNMAASSNWKFMPTANMIMAAYNQNFVTQAQAAQFWFSQLPQQAQAQAPWLQFGMTQPNYQTRSDQISSIIGSLTGNFDLSQLDPAHLQNMMATGMGTDQITNYLRNLLASQGDGWLAPQYGYTYSTWQQYKRDNRAATISRFGQNAANNDQAYFKMTSDPVTAQATARGGSLPEQQRSSTDTLRDYARSFVR